MVEKTASTIGELIDATRQVASTWRPNVADPQELWFRGQPERRFDLVPGVYRPLIRRYHYDEASLFVRFKTLAASYTIPRPVDEWEWYFLAQHYGLPTRLLDWTHSVIAAAYFAVCDSVLCRDRLTLDDDLQRGRVPSVFDDDSPAVWVMDAGTLNKRTCGEDILVYPGGPLSSSYLPEQIVGSRAPENELPLALLAPRTNVRIAAQQGVFTIHGHSSKSLNQLAAEADATNPIHVACITLDRANLAFLWDELQVAGIGRLALFPDLESVATHVKWLLQSAR